MGKAGEGKVQITVIQVDNYGPWTTTLGSDREHAIQMRQSLLYKDLQENFSQLGGLVFYNRFDELLAITNGISLEEHKRIQEDISKKHPFTISLGVAKGVKPYEAQHKASDLLHRAGSAQSDSRRGLLLGDAKPEPTDKVQIIHIDIDDSTKQLTDVLSAYETYLIVGKLHFRLAETFLRQGALTFYCGGDNFMVVASELPDAMVAGVLKAIGREFGLGLKGGVGIANTARKAMELATKNLDTIRGMEGDERPSILVSRA